MCERVTFKSKRHDHYENHSEPVLQMLFCQAVDEVTTLVDDFQYVDRDGEIWYDLVWARFWYLLQTRASKS